MVTTADTALVGVGRGKDTSDVFVARAGATVATGVGIGEAVALGPQLPTDVQMAKTRLKCKTTFRITPSDGRRLFVAVVRTATHQRNAIQFWICADGNAHYNIGMDSKTPSLENAPPDDAITRAIECRVDITLLTSNLRLTPTERMQRAQRALDSVVAFQAEVRKSRERQKQLV